RGHAAEALLKIGPASGMVPVLAELLQADDLAVRLLALEALASIGPEAQPTLPALQEASQSAEPAEREAAARAIKSVQGWPRALTSMPSSAGGYGPGRAGRCAGRRRCHPA